MENVYEKCPTYENENWLLRLATLEDAADLHEVYSDLQSVPFFNSDNCHGDNFYYETRQRMEDAIQFWIYSYENKHFVRWAIIDKKTNKVVGSIELFNRHADDDFNNVGLLRVDIASKFERANVIKEIFDLIVPPSFDLFGSDRVITKVPLYAVERQKAAADFGFQKSEKFLIGSNDHYAYKDYWEFR